MERQDTANPANGTLAGKNILIVEDNFLVAQHLRGLMERAGVIVYGPSPAAGSACEIVRNQALDGALLNVELRHGTSAPVAVALGERRIPYLIVSGMEQSSLPAEMRHAPLVGKPIVEHELYEEAARTFARAA
jgi:hypothetical protein